MPMLKVFACDFSQRFWWDLNLEWNSELPIFYMILDGKRRFNISCFMDVLMAGCWTLWNKRNRLIFDGDDVDIQSSVTIFKETFSLIRHRAKPSLKDGMS
jgi:hypothetical protein